MSGNPRKARQKLRPGAKVVFGDGRLRAEILDVEEDGNRLVKFFMMGSGKRCWIPSVKCRCLPILPISFRTKTVIRRYMQNLKALQLRLSSRTAFYKGTACPGRSDGCGYCLCHAACGTWHIPSGQGRQRAGTPYAHRILSGDPGKRRIKSTMPKQPETV